MLLSLGLILLCQLVGEAIARGSGVPVPGPVIGMVLCVVLLLARDKIGPRLPPELRNGTFEQTGQGILSHLSLLFVPLNVAAFLYIPKHLRGTAVGLLPVLRWPQRPACWQADRTCPD